MKAAFVLQVHVSLRLCAYLGWLEVLTEIMGGLKTPPSHTWCHHIGRQSGTSALPRGTLTKADSVCLVPSCGYDWYCTTAALLPSYSRGHQTSTFFNFLPSSLSFFLPFFLDTSTFYSLFLSPSPHTSCPWRSDLPPTSASGLPTQSHREGTLRGLTEGGAPAGVMFVQIMAKSVPATPHAHHHVVPEDL